jgi:hypothetical protein
LAFDLRHTRIEDQLAALRALRPDGHFDDLPIFCSFKIPEGSHSLAIERIDFSANPPLMVCRNTAWYADPDKTLKNEPVYNILGLPSVGRPSEGMLSIPLTDDNLKLVASILRPEQ